MEGVDALVPSGVTLLLRDLVDGFRSSEDEVVSIVITNKGLRIG